MSNQSILIIPSLNPNDTLISYVDTLIASGFKQICIVNDGSDAKFQGIFDEIEKREECVVLKHAVNYGKGRALKNAFNYCMVQKQWNFSGVITLDSDGQHSVQDVIKVDEILSGDQNLLILGSRNFSLENIPFKSRMGNRITSFWFKILYGMKIQDTQTGLRGISKSILPYFLDLQGERFEYETNMLIRAVREKVSIVQEPIETIYENNNEGTHFNPLVDSIKIYKILFGEFFKFAASSMGSCIVDLLLFEMLFLMLGKLEAEIRIGIATVSARVCSSALNYFLNRNVVFKSDKCLRNTMIKYYALVLIQMMASALLVAAFFGMLDRYELMIKVVVDICLFFVSFMIQKKWIFGK